MNMTDNLLLGMLNGIIETGNILDPAAVFVGVATAVVNHGQATVQADVTYATGAMATRQAVVAWGDPYKMADGRWAVDGPLMSFRPASSSEAQQLVAWTFSSLIAAGVLRAWGMITPPVSLADEFSEWSIVPRVTVDPAGRWSAEITFNG